MEHTLGEDEHAIGDIEGLTPEEVQELEDLVIEHMEAVDNDISEDELAGLAELVRGLQQLPGDSQTKVRT